MKIGVKTFDNYNLLKHFKDKINFFEIMAVETNEYDFLKQFKNVEVIHAEHQGFGINPGDKTKQELNKKAIDFAIKLANETNAKKIIIHPGSKRAEDSKEESINFIKKFNDKRIIIENMTYSEGLCFKPEEVKEFLEKTNKKFCLDINHAIESAINLKTDYKEYIKEFINLKPVHYHIGGQNIKLNKTHLSINDSDFNLKEIFSLIPIDAEITLETTTNIWKIDEDIKIINQWINELKN